PPSRGPLATRRIDTSSRAQRHDGQVLPALVAVDAQFKTRHALGQLWVTPDRHSGASLKPHDVSNTFRAAFLGSRATQRTVWPMLVVPSRVDVELTLHLDQAERHHDALTTLIFQRAPEALDDGDGFVTADGAPAGVDAEHLAPLAIIRLELHAAVGDQMLWCSTSLCDGCFQEGGHLGRVRLLAESLHGDHA